MGDALHSRSCWCSRIAPSLVWATASSCITGVRCEATRLCMAHMPDLSGGIQSTAQLCQLSKFALHVNSS